MNWKPITHPIPQHVAQVIPFDLRGRILVIHRSNTVRSARNVWSFPSELHELGETSERAATRALGEELSLVPISLQCVGCYDNIAGDESAAEQYHWVISVYLALVADVREYRNNEPDKHDLIADYKADWLLTADFSVFHKSLERFLVTHRTFLYLRLIEQWQRPMFIPEVM